MKCIFRGLADAFLELAVANGVRMAVMRMEVCYRKLALLKSVDNHPAAAAKVAHGFLAKSVGPGMKLILLGHMDKQDIRGAEVRHQPQRRALVSSELRHV